MSALALPSTERPIRRVVVKVGSAVLHGGQAAAVHRRVAALARGLRALREASCEVVVVSSGAIALGAQARGLSQAPSEIAARQALAAVGQLALMTAWREALEREGMRAAQVLLTHADLADRARYLNARHTLLTLLAWQWVPIVNENDAVAFEEIKLGDNDLLAAQVAVSIEADLLVLLTEVDGLYTTDPRRDPGAVRIDTVEDVAEVRKRVDLGDAARWGAGGMRSKLEAAEAAGRAGIAAIVASGCNPGVLEALARGEPRGTLVRPDRRRLRGRKHWIAFARRPAGRIVVDDGAVRALVRDGRSLLPSGIVRVEGRFGPGDTVRIVDVAGREVARGLTAYSSDEVAVIAGRHTADIEAVLGYRYADEVVHRDDLVVVARVDSGAPGEVD